MIIYHGSDHIIERPLYHYGNRRNDYGFGFYCTENKELAKEWASSSEYNGFVNKYDLDESELRILDLNEYGLLTWLTILLENRSFSKNTPLAREAYEYLISNFKIEYESFDIIKGYRADDSYFSFARDFINGTISYEQLSAAMRLGDLGNQIVLKSEKAFSKIEYIGAENVDSRIWYQKRQERDNAARNAYLNSFKGYARGDIYITHILDEEMKNDNVRLQ